MVQRYKIGYSTWQGHETAQPVQMPNGEYVTHADYATLLAAHKELCEAVKMYTSEVDNNAACWVMRKKYRGKMNDLAARELEQDDAN